MQNENSIGLAELIEQVKRELLSTTSDAETDVPLLSVDQIELELQVTARKEAKGGLKVYVVQLGGGGSRDDVQKVKVTLSPLFNKEERLKKLKQENPEKYKDTIEKSYKLNKGGNSNLSKKYG